MRSALRWVTPRWWRPRCRWMTSSCPRSPAAERLQAPGYSEAKLDAVLFGVRQADLPADWTSFMAVHRETDGGSDKLLAVSPAARDIAQQIFSGARSRIARTQMVSRADGLFAAGAVAEDILGFEFGEREQCSMSECCVDPAHLSLPSHAPARGGPHQEALSRLQGDQRPDLAVRSAEPALDRPGDRRIEFALLAGPDGAAEIRTTLTPPRYRRSRCYCASAIARVIGRASARPVGPSGYRLRHPLGRSFSGPSARG